MGEESGCDGGEESGCNAEKGSECDAGEENACDMGQENLVFLSPPGCLGVITFVHGNRMPINKALARESDTLLLVNMKCDQSPSTTRCHEGGPRRLKCNLFVQNLKFKEEWKTSNG